MVVRVRLKLSDDSAEIGDWKVKLRSGQKQCVHAAFLNNPLIIGD